jgi:hypothetical protein
VAEAVVGDGVAIGAFAPHKLGVRRGVAANEKEGRAHAFALERVEHGICRAGPGSVVEGQHDLLLGKWQGLQKMLAANARRRRRRHRHDAGR